MVIADKMHGLVVEHNGTTNTVNLDRRHGNLLPVNVTVHFGTVTGCVELHKTWKWAGLVSCSTDDLGSWRDLAALISHLFVHPTQLQVGWPLLHFQSLGQMVKISTIADSGSWLKNCTV